MPPPFSSSRDVRLDNETGESQISFSHSLYAVAANEELFTKTFREHTGQQVTLRACKNPRVQTVKNGNDGVQCY